MRTGRLAVRGLGWGAEGSAVSSEAGDLLKTWPLATSFVVHSSTAAPFHRDCCRIVAEPRLAFVIGLASPGVLLESVMAPVVAALEQVSGMVVLWLFSSQVPLSFLGTLFALAPLDSSVFRVYVQLLMSTISMYKIEMLLR